MRPTAYYVQVPLSSNSIQTQQQQPQQQQVRYQQAEDDPRYFNRPVRINYEQCMECGLNKEKNNICLSTKCDYFQLVCPFCHPHHHKIDVKLTYQYQDLDLFLQDIVRLTQGKTTFAKQELSKGELHKIIDQRINQLDLVAAQIEQLKSVLMLKKQTLSNVFSDYDVVYKELQELYKVGYNKSLTKTLELLKEKLLFKKSSNSKQWELGWRNEESILENYFNPIQEQKGSLLQGVSQNSLVGGQQQQKQQQQLQKGRPSVIQEVDEDQESLSSASGGRGKIELQRFRDPLNNAIDKIEIAVNQMQKIAGELLQSQQYRVLVENQSTAQMVNQEKERCVRECNKVLKQSQIHFQWEDFEQMKTPSMSPSSIVAKFCAIFLTRPYSEDEGEEIPKPNLEKMFEVFLKAKDSIKKLEQFDSKNYVYSNYQQRKQ